MDEIKSAKVNITYFTDPLCCWCWAFEEKWQLFKQEYASIVNWHYCMGGLLPDWQHFNDTVNSISRPIQMGAFWMYVAKTAGVTINHRLWYDDPPASSYPSCVAIKCAQQQSPEAAEVLLAQLRKSSMTCGANIARKEVIMEIATGVALQIPLLFDVELFKKDFSGGKALDDFRQDLQYARYNGISRFPTLLVRKGKQAVLLNGNISYDMLINACQ